MRGLINTIREMNLVKEDGHVDVSSSIRKCKTAMEDASQIMSKLQTMDPEGSLPTWWTNKLAIASMSFNKMRDYLLVSGEQKEEVDLSEKEKGIGKLPRQFLNPDKEEMIIKGNKVIVINKKDLEKYTKKGWSLAEKLDDKDEPTVKDVVKLLKKASQAHAGQAKDLEKAVND
jgi:hypothetical protein